MLRWTAVDMFEIFSAFFHEKSAWELIAVGFGIAYLVLAMKESLWCWPAALVSTAIYTWLFWHVALLMDSALNVYYMLMAVYGFWSWSNLEKRHSNAATLGIATWPLPVHLLAIFSVAVVSLFSGYLLSGHTEAAWPYLDSFTTWGSVLTTYMVAKKVLENWVYWIIIDAVAMLLYIERGLYPTAMLFFVYLILCVFGFVAWQKKYRAQHANPVLA